ncbi:MAG: PIN domain-containing protein [Bacteroidetes bacterium]|nr:PIN domain-containing protein [Bacteroidota bacterium]
MKHFLLDTNVVIDFLVDRKPFSHSAAKLFGLSHKNKVKLYITAVSYNVIYYLYRKDTTHEEAIKTLRAIEQLTETIDTTNQAIKNALYSDFKDFEDAVQYYTAKTNKKIDAIVTRNGVDFKLSKIPVLTPNEAVGVIESIR